MTLQVILVQAIGAPSGERSPHQSTEIAQSSANSAMNPGRIECENSDNASGTDMNDKTSSDFQPVQMVGPGTVNEVRPQ